MNKIRAFRASWSLAAQLPVQVTAGLSTKEHLPQPACRKLYSDDYVRIDGSQGGKENVYFLILEL
jgi:hypothetical protein